VPAPDLLLNRKRFGPETAGGAPRAQHGRLLCSAPRHASRAASTAARAPQLAVKRELRVQEQLWS